MRELHANLSKAVEEKLEGLSRGRDAQELSDAIKEAIRLSDKYADITPEPYILPLDAMAGFPVRPQVKKMLAV